MCGILGEVKVDGGVARAALDAASGGIPRHGPVNERSWTDERRRCGFTSCRLGVIDLGPLARQPMQDPDTGYAIMFGGDIYGHQELRRDCEQNEAVSPCLSDTELILALFACPARDAIRARSAREGQTGASMSSCHDRSTIATPHERQR
jgi:asparagine synthase (glutamine-hydrolysing)